MFVCIPQTEGYGTCIKQCSACEEYQLGKGRFGKGYYQLPAIRTHVEYTPWWCMHGELQVMLTITEIYIYETVSANGVNLPGSCRTIVRMW